MRITDFINEDLSLNTSVILSVPEFSVLQGTEQNPMYHAEGSAWAHTLNVVSNMQSYLKLENDISHNKKLVMMAAALFHDIGKGPTTIKDEDGNWTSPNHAIEGEKLTRKILWDETFWNREEVCGLVRYHMKPLFFNHVSNPFKQIIKLSLHCYIPDLIMLSLCDQKGSIKGEEDGLKDEGIESLHYLRRLDEEIRHGSDRVSKEMAEAYTSAFANNRQALFNYLHSQDEPTENKLPELVPDKLPRLVIHIMCGLPGSGKNYFIENNFKKTMPVICRDDIRTEIGIPGEKPFGTKEQERQVSQIAEKRMIEYAKEGKNFIINNTHLAKRWIDNIINLTKEYGANYVIHYVEAPSWDDNLKRREGLIPLSEMDRMRNNMEMPSLESCHQLLFHFNV